MILFISPKNQTKQKILITIKILLAHPNLLIEVQQALKAQIRPNLFKEKVKG